MLRTLHASTFEVDDQDIAVQEILDQLDFSELLDSTIGIVSCELEFIANGTVKALSERLPFDIVGSTSNVQDVCGESGEFQLALLVLTGDDVSFAAGVSEPLPENAQEKIDALYQKAAASLPEDPVFGILIASFIFDMSGDAQMQALDKASGGLPIFGSVAADYTDTIRDPRTIYNGGDFNNRLVIILASGNIEPKFFFKAIPEECFSKQKAIITSSSGNILMEVNNIPAIAYIESLGLASNGHIESVPSIPLSIDVGDGGSPVARAILATTPEGYVVCGGDMPENAIVGVGSIDPGVVRTTAEEMAREIMQAGKTNGALIVSCLSRNMALGFDNLAEVGKVQEYLGQEIPYLFLYSAGELYPEVTEEKTYNKAHNDSIIACVF